MAVAQEIPDILEQGEIFLGLVDQAPIAAVLERVVGPDVRCWQALARTLPAPVGREDDPLAKLGYSTWHRDSKMAPDSWPIPEGRVVKTFTYIHSVPEDGGCTTLVPRSHRLPGGPRETLACRFAGAAHDFGLAAAGAAEQGEVEPLDAALMPNQLPLAVPAGVTMMFDVSVWHTALPNLSSVDRSSVILYFDARRPPTAAFGQSVDRLEAFGRLDRPRLRKMLAL